MMSSKGALALLIPVFFSLGVASAAAQSGLEQVEQLTRLGRAEEARTALTEWWDGDRDNASRRELQRGLWLRGRLTVDPVQAELDFQRLAVLYPSGIFTPDAIFRLAQGSWAMGDEARARQHVATLERDYPRSDARERAVAWLASAGPLPPEGDTPTRGAAAAAPSRAEPQADSSAARNAVVRDPDTGRAAATRSTPRARTDAAVETRPGEEGAADEAQVMNYYVQLGAFADQERAFALYEEIRAGGIDVRVVRVAGSQFTHVRVGRFAEREAAVELLDRLTAQGISAALVRDDRAEQTIRE